MTDDQLTDHCDVPVLLLSVKGRAGLRDLTAEVAGCWQLGVDDVDAVLPAVTPRLYQPSVVGVHLHPRHRELPHLLAAGQPARMDPIELPAVLVPLDAVNLKKMFSIFFRLKIY